MKYRIIHYAGKVHEPAKIERCGNEVNVVIRMSSVDSNDRYTFILQADTIIAEA